MHQLKMMKAIAFATYKEWAAFRTHMWLSLFVGPIYFAVQYFIWSSIYSDGMNIQGMDINDMLKYYGISAIIGYLTFDFAQWNLQMLIHTGKYTSFLHRPISHIYFAFCQKIGHRTLAFFNEFLPVCIIFIFIFNVNLMPDNLIYGIITVLLSFVLQFFIHYLIGLSAFWLTRNNGIRGIFGLLSSICSGVIIPLSFMPLAIQKIMIFLPFQYAFYVPIKIFTGNYELAGVNISIPMLLCLQAVIVLIFAFLTKVVEKEGIKKYTGVGI